jgi:hypothetical protein
MIAGRLGALRAVADAVWAPMVLVRGRASDATAAPPAGTGWPCGWLYDEEQWLLWRRRLRRAARSSDDDDESDA